MEVNKEVKVACKIYMYVYNNTNIDILDYKILNI